MTTNKPQHQNSVEEELGPLACVTIGLSGVAAVLAMFAWFVVLPTVGLLYLCGYYAHPGNTSVVEPAEPSNLIASENEPVCSVSKINGTPKFGRRIGDMETGESGWTVPWALDPVGKTLHPTHAIHPSPGGTVQMKVIRRDDGYEVDIPDDYRW